MKMMHSYQIFSLMAWHSSEILLYLLSQNIVFLEEKQNCKMLHEISFLHLLTFPN